MNIQEKASRIKNLRDNETFKEVISEVRERQIGVFMNPNSSTEDREKAHSVVCALEEINGFMESVVTDAKLEDR